MKLNFRQFKKIKEDGASAVLKHPAGHEIRIAKRNLTPGMRKQLSNLEMHSESLAKGYQHGGGVEQAVDLPIEEEARSQAYRAPAEDMDQYSPTPQQSLPVEAPPVSKGEMGPTVGTVGKTTQPSPYAEEQFKHTGNVPLGVAPKTAASVAPVVPEQMDIMGQHLKKIGAAYEGMARSQEQIGQLEEQKAQQIGKAKAIEAEQAKNLTTLAMNEMHRVLGDMDTISGELAAAKINPEDYWESKSTAGKVASAIGIVLGGIGAGLTGGENVALKFLNQQIDRNIAAQRAKMDNQKTLLGFYTQKYGTIAAGQTALAALMKTQYAAQFEEAALKAQGPIEAQKAKMAAQKFRTEAAQLMYPLEYQRAMINMYSQGRMPDEMIIDTFVPEAQRPEAYKQLREYRIHKESSQNVLSAFDKLAEDNTLYNRAGRLGFEPPSSAAFDNLILPMIKDAEGKVSEYEAEQMNKLKSDLLTKKSTAAESREWLVKWLNQRAHFPLLRFLQLKGPVTTQPKTPVGGKSLPPARR